MLSGSVLLHKQRQRAGDHAPKREAALITFLVTLSGVVIAGIVLALYLPLFQLTSVIGNS